MFLFSDRSHVHILTPLRCLCRALPPPHSRAHSHCVGCSLRRFLHHTQIYPDSKLSSQRSPHCLFCRYLGTRSIWRAPQRRTEMKGLPSSTSPFRTSQTKTVRAARTPRWGGRVKHFTSLCVITSGRPLKAKELRIKLESFCQLSR